MTEDRDSTAKRGFGLAPDSRDVISRYAIDSPESEGLKVISFVSSRIYWR
jgi:hypothetical protein